MQLSIWIVQMRSKRFITSLSKQLLLVVLVWLIVLHSVQAEHNHVDDASSTSHQNIELFTTNSTSTNSTSQPTIAPTTMFPSFKPSFRPSTTRPTSLPPTKLPTIQPSFSLSPTIEPSYKPTRAPTATPMPTIRPTRRPSPSPSIASIKMDGGFVLRNVDLTTFSGTTTQQSILETIVKNTIANITSLSSDNIVDISMTTSMSAAASSLTKVNTNTRDSNAETLGVQNAELQPAERKPSTFLRRLLEESSSSNVVTATSQATVLTIHFAVEGRTAVISKALATTSGDISVLMSTISTILQDQQGGELIQTLKYYASTTLFSGLITSSTGVEVLTFIDITATGAPSLNPTQAPAFDTSKPSTRLFITMIVVPIVIGLLCIYVIGIWVVFYSSTAISRGIYPNQPVNKNPKFTSSLASGGRKKSVSSIGGNSIDDNSSVTSSPVKRKSQSKYAITPIETDGLNDSPGRFSERASSPESPNRASALSGRSSPMKQANSNVGMESNKDSPMKTPLPGAPGSRAITNYTPGKYVNMK